MNTNQIPDSALDAWLETIFVAAGFLGASQSLHGTPENIMGGMRAALRATVGGLAPFASQRADQKPDAWLFQCGETGRVSIIDAQQDEWGFEKNNPRMQRIKPLYAHPAPAGATPMTDARIKEICLSHGYTIKPGEADLKPYVYAAARQVAAEAVAAASADGRGTDAQIIREREIASCSIMGALAAGAAGQPEPEPEYGKPHWLLPAHQAGAELAQARLEAMNHKQGNYAENTPLRERVARARKSFSAMQKNAERYLWLTGDALTHAERAARDEILSRMGVMAVMGRGSADAAIDEAMKTVKESLTVEPVAHAGFDRREPGAPGELVGAGGKDGTA